MSNTRPKAAKPPQWNSGSKLFHWLIAGLIFSAITVAILAGHWGDLGGTRKQQYWLFMLHKSLGLTVLLLAIGRLLWRLTHQRPAPLASHRHIERTAAEGAHFALYILLFLLPLSGWWLNSVAGIPLKYFLLFKVPALVAASLALEDLAKWVHNALAVALLIILSAHIAGALKHHLLDKDTTLQRMLPDSVLGKFTGAVMALLVIGMAGVFTFAELTETTTSNAPSQPIATNSVDAAATNWTTHDSSQLTFDVNVSGDKVEGLFKRFNAAVNFAPDSLGSSSIYATIFTESIFTDNSTRDEMLPEADWFSVQKHPIAEFKTGNIRDTGDGKYLADATLRIRDVTRNIEFPFHWQQSGDSATLTATVTLNRLDYQLGADEFGDAETIALMVPVKVLLKLTR